MSLPGHGFGSNEQAMDSRGYVFSKDAMHEHLTRYRESYYFLLTYTSSWQTLTSTQPTTRTPRQSWPRKIMIGWLHCNGSAFPRPRPLRRRQLFARLSISQTPMLSYNYSQAFKQLYIINCMTTRHLERYFDTYILILFAQTVTIQIPILLVPFFSISNRLLTQES